MATKGRPSKRAKLLSDAGASSDESDDAGVQLPETTGGFKINEEFAKRFEHNKKREERHRLEEKHKGVGTKRGRDGEEDEEESSDDEDEDDEAELVTDDVDEGITDVLKALRSKDPRIYDTNIKFYKEYDPDASESKAKKEKPMYLQDYHRQTLLAGNADEGDEDDAAPQTYQQEQDALKKRLVGDMHASAAQNGQESGDEEDDEQNFLVAKSKPQHDSLPTAVPKRKAITDQDVASADKDPETYLSNFMAAQAWRNGSGPGWGQAFESDDSEDERRADEFEEAYNLRFEDPAHANETLRSFARDVGKYGVRRDEKSGRAKAREREREQKEAAKRERDEERARLRKLKIEEAEEKIARIREAAGLKGKDVDLDQWRDVIEGDFDDQQWDDEMKRRFGEKYYAEDEGSEAAPEEDEEDGGKKRKDKKPKWDDDIDIKDLVPDFDDSKPEFTLSDDEGEDEIDGGAPLPAEAENEDSDEQAEGAGAKKKRKTKSDRQKDKVEAKRAARKQRRAIEEMVDSALPLAHPSLATTSASNKAPVTGFRYRATSPTSFGLSVRDILFADDAALNQFAGLKKMHSWREDEKKRRDRKKFSKKGRLRQWRKETFGKDGEPAGGFEAVVGGGTSARDEKAKSALETDVKEGERKKRRKRSGRKGKGGGEESAEAK